MKKNLDNIQKNGLNIHLQLQTRNSSTMTVRQTMHTRLQ